VLIKLKTNCNTNSDKTLFTCAYRISLSGTTWSHSITCALAGLVIGNCQDMDRIDVQLTFSSDVFQIKLASI